ncbi:CBD9-like protein [Bimuria novae-zelandiae CBS 107.79]|uniref:CBD9-like protein n=1 Tax=Bimuria novae-zelandiae CBS 107.79 TaxID=1447943 RepID=A0A6A5VI64_9PLEO|nr:CBD9-like protein [Bimuria novae-zelandiae CBS 107.79]
MTKLLTLLVGGIATLAAAQTAAPYTDAKSNITFQAYQHTTGYFLGLALPNDPTGNTDVIVTIGGKGTGWSGVSLAGPMKNALLVLAWPNSQAIVGSFRKTAQYGSPLIATGTFTQTLIANGTYINSTHWTYTFLCSKCIQTDGTTFAASANTTVLGYALNSAAPSNKANAASSVSKHTSRGQVTFDLVKARSKDFATWKAWATPKVQQGFQA